MIDRCFELRLERARCIPLEAKLEAARVAGDHLLELCLLLDLAGARLSFDRGRSTRLPCTFCGAAKAPFMETIGRYLDGSPLTRPVCVECAPRIDQLKRRPKTPWWVEGSS